MDLKLISEEKKHWIDPLIIDTEDELVAFIDALETAAAAPVKSIYVKYKNVTNENEIKKIFDVI